MATTRSTPSSKASFCVLQGNPPVPKHTYQLVLCCLMPPKCVQRGLYMAWVRANMQFIAMDCHRKVFKILSSPQESPYL